MKRSIRIKEFTPFSNEYLFPSENYIKSRTGLSTNHGYLRLTDSNGYLSNAIPHRKEDQNIFLVGDSSIENIYCDFNKKISFLTQKKLLQKGINCSLYNMGVSGSTTLNIFNTIINKLIGKTGEILFFIPSNDSHALNFFGGYLNNFRQYTNILPLTSDNTEKGFYEENKKSLLSFLKLLKIFCEEFNFRLHVFGAIYRSPNNAIESMNSMVESFCSENEITYLEVKNYPESSFYDDVHVNELGSNHIAQIITQHLLNYFTPINKKTIHIEKINTSNCQELKLQKPKELTLITDIQNLGKAEHNCFLAKFDFGKNKKISPEDEKSYNLTNSKHVGYYRYLKIPEPGKRAVMVHSFKFPNHIENISIGLVKFRSPDEFILHDAEVIYRI